MTETQPKYRHPTRLRDYDYSQSGGYFITICTKDSENWLGDFKEDILTLTPIGNIIQQCWMKLFEDFNTIISDQYVVMPNHFHGIVILDNKRGLMNQTTTGSEWILMKNPNPTLGKIVRAFKARSTKLIRDAGFGFFQWQRNYYEHVIRDAEELNRIREYIINNPLKWIDDRENKHSMNYDQSFEKYFEGIMKFDRRGLIHQTRKE